MKGKVFHDIRINDTVDLIFPYQFTLPKVEYNKFRDIRDRLKETDGWRLFYLRDELQFPPQFPPHIKWAYWFQEVEFGYIPHFFFKSEEEALILRMSL